MQGAVTVDRPVAYWLIGCGGIVAGMVTVGGLTRLTKVATPLRYGPWPYSHTLLRPLACAVGPVDDGLEATGEAAPDHRG